MKILEYVNTVHTVHASGIRFSLSLLGTSAVLRYVVYSMLSCFSDGSFTKIWRVIIPKRRSLVTCTAATPAVSVIRKRGQSILHTFPTHDFRYMEVKFCFARHEVQIAHTVIPHVELYMWHDYLAIIP